MLFRKGTYGRIPCRWCVNVTTVATNEADLALGQVGEVMQQRGTPVHARLGVDDLVETGDAKAGSVAALTAVHEVAERQHYLQQRLQLSTSQQVTRRFQNSCTSNEQ